MENKQIPQAIDLERVVLGGLLYDSNAYAKIAEIFTVDLFYTEQHQLIAETIIELHNFSNPVDLLTVSSSIIKKGKTKVAPPYYISELCSQSASTSNIEYHTRILMQMSLKRSLIDISNECNTSAFDLTEDIFETIDLFEKKVNVITSRIISEKINNVGELYIDSVKQTQAIKTAKNGIIGVPSGFTDLDKKTSGWQKTDLIILAARPGMGKTAFALNVARNAAVDYNKAGVIFSLEMGKLQLMARLKASETGLHLEKFLRTGLTEFEESQSHTQCHKLVNSPIYIDDEGGLSVFKLRNKARKLKREKGIEWIIIDYIQLMTEGGKFKGNREAEVSSISRQLKSLAKELNIPIICLSQLSRECEKRPDKIPQLSDLRDSGAIEQDADMVMFIYRPEYYGLMEDSEGQSTQGKAMVIIAKHRNGGLCKVQLSFLGHNTKFYDENLQERNDFKSLPNGLAEWEQKM